MAMISKSLLYTKLRYSTKRLSSIFASTAPFENTWDTKGGPKITEVVRMDGKRLLQVKWNDGKNGLYAYPWLIDNAQQSYNLGAKNRARTLLMKDFDTKVLPSSVEVLDDGQSVNLSWNSQYAPTLFYSQWLYHRNFSDPKFHQSRQLFSIEEPKSWDSDDFLQRKSADFPMMMGNDRYFRDRLKELMKFGILHVTNAPKQSGVLHELGQRIGYRFSTHHDLPEYQGVFSVKVEIDHSNLANTANELGLHTDMPAKNQTPQIQTLHAIKQAGEGGENQFVDGFKVAQQLKSEQPEVFNLLTTYPTEFVDWCHLKHKYIDLAHWKTIECNSSEHLSGIYFNNQVRSWYYNAPAEIIPQLYDALRTFYDYCTQKRSLVQVKLNEGEMMMFANNRILHGRSAFKAPTESQTSLTRHFEGCYFCFDAVRSRIRAIDEELNENKHVSW